MIIRNIIHKGLRRFVEDDDASGVPATSVEKIRNIISFLQQMDDASELRSISSWKAHQLTGNRKGEWSLAVTRNWRITFSIDRANAQIVDLDFEDYH
jgi:proteic killer suppression protein